MRKKTCFAIVLALSTPLLADECFSTCECCKTDYSAVLSIKHREPGGIGYPRGYTSLDLFYTPSITENLYGFFDLRGHIFNDGKWAANAGIGARYLSSCSDVINGLNLYWDFRDTNRGSYQQIGVGYELLFPCFDFDFNGHIPIGRKRQGSSPRFDRFEGHSAFFAKKFTLNMGGFDTSLGYWLYRNDCFAVHASLGGYYFRGDFKTDFGGGFAKAKVDLWKYIELEGQVSYDNQFKWIGQGQLGLNIPFGPNLTRYPRKTACCSEYIDLERRLVDAPDRFEIIVTTSKKQEGRALHPVTQEPLTFYFVDNTSSSNGSIESPFPTIKQAETASSPGDAIYIFPGNGAGYDETLTLKNLQLLGGSGAPFLVSTRFGIQSIPQLTRLKPQMIGSGNKVTLANDNRISGMGINSIDSFGIIGMDPINNFSAINNTIVAEVEGIVFEKPFTGNFVAQGNSITTLATQGNGILFFTGSTFNGSFLATENIIQAKNRGILFFTSATFDGNFSIANNMITVEDGAGIEFADSFKGNFKAEKNIIDAGTISLLFFTSFEGDFLAKNNKIIAKEGGIAFFPISPFTGNFQATNNIIQVGAIGIDFPESFTGSMLINGNTITGFADIGLNLTLTDGTATVSDNTILTETGNGPVIITSTSIDATIENNLFSAVSSTDPAFDWTQTGSGLSRARFVKNTSLSSGAPNTTFDGSNLLEIFSPNGELSGLQAINEGIIEAIDVTFFSD